MIVSERNRGEFWVNLNLQEQTQLIELRPRDEANSRRQLERVINAGLFPPGVCKSCSRRPGKGE